MNRWILGAAGALVVLAPTFAADQPVIKSVTFAPLPISAGAPVGTPIGTLDVTTSGMAVKPTIKTYTDSSVCTLPASLPPATVKLSKPLVAGNYACTFIAALSNAIGSPFIQTIVFNVQSAPAPPPPVVTSPDGSVLSSGAAGTLVTANPIGTWKFGPVVGSGNWKILLDDAWVGTGSKMQVCNSGRMCAIGSDGQWVTRSAAGQWTKVDDPNLPVPPPSADPVAVTLNSPADVAARRQALIQLVWGTSALPTTVPTVTAVANPFGATLPNVGSTWNYHAAMSNGQVNDSTLYVNSKYVAGSSSPEGQVVIFNPGHQFGLTDWPSFDGPSRPAYNLLPMLKGLLDKGFSVLALNMPAGGDPTQHAALFSSYGTTAFQYFLEPTIQAMNQWSKTGQFSTFSAIGLSGGGWTGTLVQALDLRLKNVVADTGSMAGVYYLTPPEDKEQVWAPFYSVAAYEDLYLMGASGPGRRQVHIYNINDSWGWNPSHWTNEMAAANKGRNWFQQIDYSNNLIQAAQTKIPNQFSIVEDYTAVVHQFSVPGAVNLVVNTLSGNPPPLGVSTLGAPTPSPPPSPPPSGGNVLPISNGSSNAVTNYPFQFGRPFVSGEIPNYPKVVFNGTPIQTQVDVKNRHVDGSVKYAVISVVLPSLPPGTAKNLTFQDQPTGNTAPVWVVDLLTQFSDFDANFMLSGVQTSVSARDMLEKGYCKPWTSGPVEVVLQCYDRSVARIYDLDPTGKGWKPFHPEFELSFWLPTKQVQVRYVGEVTNSMALEAFTADVKLTTGKANPTVVYQQAAVPHSIKTRWTRVVWIGGAPEPKINIDHNIAHLSKTGYLWNFDASAKIPESILSDAYVQWQNSNHGNILSPGLWMKGMPDTGYHPDIGPMPVWYNRAVYSGDYRMREVMLGQADLVGAFGAQVREGDSARYTTRAKTTSALGLPVTQYVRPYYRGTDSIPVRSPPYNVWDDDQYQHSGWTFDTSHQPDPFSVPYLLTGDPFYLEGLQLWGAMDTFGPEGLYLWFYQSGQARSQAWTLRTVASAWGMSPDADPMRAAFHDALDDIFAAWEGERGIRGTKFEGTPAWQQTFVRIGHADQGEAWLGLGPPPLHFWNFLAGNPADCNQWYFNPAICERDYTPWQVGFLGVAMSHAIELRYTDALPTLRWFAENFVGQLIDPTYNPGLALQFIAPATKKGPNGQPVHFTSWAELKTAWSAALIAKVESFAPDATLYWPGTGHELYWDVARGGMGAIADKVPNGILGWQRLDDWLKQLAAHTSAPDWNTDPTWDILPRTVH